ncbi:MAG: hypothetical protein ACYSU0_16945 [Planctomycetota bacterium]|jgi:hypothetical protein
MRRKALVAAALGAALSYSCPAEEGRAGQSEPRPLDKRTRCIALFREVLVRLSDGNLAGAFSRIADSGGKTYRLVPKDAAEKMASEDGDDFVEHNFPHHEKTLAAFDEILYSDLSTESEDAVLKKDRSAQGVAAKVHVMTIKIPGIADERFRKLRFVEGASGVYWVPFGW